MEHKFALLDTSFFIRLLNERDPLHKNTLGYYRYFLEHHFVLKCSTVSIAEYCVQGSADELPLKDLQILPFNFNHAQRAGELAKIVFLNRSTLSVSSRNIIPNDTKLFAQADSEEDINIFATTDEECIKIYNLLDSHRKLNFDIMNVRRPYTETFGILFDL